MKVTIITPTTGKDSLFKLIESLKTQDCLENIEYEHILLWDDFREGKFLYPDAHGKIKTPNDLEDKNTYSIVIKGYFIQGSAKGSALRSIGLMAASGDYVTFADDDVWFDSQHLYSLFSAIQGKEWAYGMRKIYHNGEYLGIDNFESVGDSPTKKVPYEMVDNNIMMFTRIFATSGAVIYRETKEYNDDRLMYDFLKKHAGTPGKTNIPTTNQECPDRLAKMFKENCVKKL